MPRIDKVVAVHRLSVYPTKKTGKQKIRVFAPEWQKVIEEEIAKLLDADFIFEIDYLE